MRNFEDDERPTRNTSEKEREQMEVFLPEIPRLDLSLFPLFHCYIPTSGRNVARFSKDFLASYVAKKQCIYLLSRSLKRSGQGGHQEGHLSPAFCASHKYLVFLSGLTRSQIKGTGTGVVMSKFDYPTSLQGWRLTIISFDLKKKNVQFLHVFLCRLKVPTG